MVSHLVTDSFRGMGLAMARHLLSLPPSKVSTVFATARSESVDLKAPVSSSNERAVFLSWMLQMRIGSSRHLKRLRVCLEAEVLMS